MDGEGYIRLYWKTKRSIVGSNPVALGLWAHILLSCAVKRRILDNGTILEPGECVISIAKLADSDPELNRKKLTRYLNSLEADGMIKVVKRDRNGTKLSVCNFTTYQPQFFDEGQKRNSKGTAKEHERNMKGTQTESPKSPKKPKRVFTPPTVEEVAAYISEKGYPLDAETFVASYQRQGWKLNNGRPVTCWKSCVTTWEKKRQQWANEKTAKETASRPKDVDLRL